MDIKPLISDPSLLGPLESLRGKTYSDIVDARGMQYVDLVMEGGGMLGIALVGYTWALEQAGIRFLGIGGTSAGSINALLLAALGTPADAKSPKLLQELASLDFYQFVDGDDDARDLIDAWTRKAGKVKLAFKAVQCIDNLNERLGLNPGDRFQQWISGLLQRENVATLAALTQRMNTVPTGLRTRAGAALDTPEKMKSGLAIVAADVSTETKVVFPQLAHLYFANPDIVDPALFVRASMSIPYFFEPLRINNLPQGSAAEQNWAEMDFACSEEACGVPDHALFVDGGIMSNFPIDAFHDYDSIVPLAPTFGVKLEYDRRWHAIDGPMDLFGAIFNSARHCLDYDFVRRNPEYSQLVQHIPCASYNWLDFNMSEDSKRGLFREGAERAITFLQGFDWQKYKNYRQQLHAATRLVYG
ncbi:MAG: hypothetical protein RL210_2517 [Pseudomonadota bacterium]|jgi:NTE family protein